MLFTIDSDYNVTAHSGPVPEREDAIRFSSQAELLQATANWPMPQFTALWNSFAGVPPLGDLKPVKKFETRSIAAKRIWEAIQKIGMPASQVPPEELTSQEMPKSKHAAKKASARAQAAPKRARAKSSNDSPAKPREGTKKEIVINLITRKSGATLQEVMDATGWQPHSVRGFIATLQTKHGIQVSSSKNESGDRMYQAARA